MDTAQENKSNITKWLHLNGRETRGRKKRGRRMSRKKRRRKTYSSIHSFVSETVYTNSHDRHR